MSAVSCIVLAVFFFAYSLGYTLEYFDLVERAVIARGATVVAGFTGAVLLFLDFLFTIKTKPPVNPFVVLILAGLLTAPAMALDIFEVERAKAHGAGAVAFVEPDAVPQPAPTPGPEGVTCTNCNGTGKVRSGDGLSWMNCQVCDGDGKVTLQDRVNGMQRTVSTLIDENNQLTEELREALDALKSYRGPSEKPSPAPAKPRSWQPVVHPLVWLDNLKDAKSVADEKGLPVFVYWTADYCAPCQKWKKEVLPDAEIQELLSRCICVQLDIEDQDSSSIRKWNMETTMVPTFFVVAPDVGHKRFDGGSSLSVFKDWLKESVDWAEKQPVKVKSVGRCDCVTTGVCTCGDDCQCPGCPEHTPQNSRLSGLVRNTALWDTDIDTRKVFVSTGGDGISLAQWGYGGYAQGSAGGYPTYGGYQQSYYQPRSVQSYYPQYYQPRVRYTAPSYGSAYYNGPLRSWGYSGGYSNGGGRTMVCGPNGCSFQ
jgi:hypothetical protein